MQTDIPLIIGAPFEGGFYSGRFFIGAQAFALITVPKALGEIKPLPWNQSLTSVAGALSYCDGLANTRAMAEAGSELAQQALALRIGGFDDWHIPSRLQQLVSFYELQSAVAFALGGPEAFEHEWYWSSTQLAAYPDCAWVQYFGDGYQYGSHKSYGYRARAVRISKLP